MHPQEAPHRLEDLVVRRDVIGPFVGGHPHLGAHHDLLIGVLTVQRLGHQDVVQRDEIRLDRADDLVLVVARVADQRRAVRGPRQIVRIRRRAINEKVRHVARTVEMR